MTLIIEPSFPAFQNVFTNQIWGALLMKTFLYGGCWLHGVSQKLRYLNQLRVTKWVWLSGLPPSTRITISRFHTFEPQPTRSCLASRRSRASNEFKCSQLGSITLLTRPTLTNNQKYHSIESSKPFEKHLKLQFKHYLRYKLITIKERFKFFPWV